jgi:hypothetical protein
MMKRFFALCVIMGMAMPFAGCEKKAETKPAAAPAATDAPATTDAPAGDAEKK